MRCRYLWAFGSAVLVSSVWKSVFPKGNGLQKCNGVQVKIALLLNHSVPDKCVNHWFSVKDSYDDWDDEAKWWLRQ